MAHGPLDSPKQKAIVGQPATLERPPRSLAQGFSNLNLQQNLLTDLLTEVGGPHSLIQWVSAGA